MKLKLAMIIAGGILLIVGIYVVVKLISYLEHHDLDRPENRLDPWITNVFEVEANLQPQPLPPVDPIDPGLSNPNCDCGCSLEFGVCLSAEGQMVLTNAWVAPGRPFNFVLERSHDLQTWISVKTNVGPCSVMLEGACSNAFYRAMLPPRH